MHINKKKLLIIGVIMLLLNVFIVMAGKDTLQKDYSISFNYEGDGKELQLYYSGEIEAFNEVETYHLFNTSDKSFDFKLNKSVRNLRIDLGSESDRTYEISNLQIRKNGNMLNLNKDNLEKFESKDCKLTMDGDTLKITSTGIDPYIKFVLADAQVSSILNISDSTYILLGGICLAFDVIFIIFLMLARRSAFSKDLIENRKLIWKLSVNDFKTKFAGSFFGIFWAFVSPIVTILVYWFVFQVGFRSADIGSTPFVLWLIVGIVPWFFFQDAITAGTNALIDYSYLVKKVVFKIDILPIVKIISALFVHIFFLAFAFTIFAFYGRLPSIYSVQVIYYLFALLVFLTGLCFATSSIVVFFKDLGQIIQISLQIGTWMTPILWNYATTLSPKLVLLFKINPLFYIVEGYRDCFINQVWFWERPTWSLYFWGFTIILFIIGIKSFKRLKNHFADVL